ncbi:TVP38/TMEM64 family protein [Nocardia bhagyanarayanae]|uniref:TVP38/TMEM64 family membrane protein n=1 Tax=Nocardia bhagyanarayanae TaxID=1215925 RepID=A0A543FE79_9NOCA|nr:TVP38/TMEM64 family protein [Nocardia bhagyanarayanae]TQM32147.1 putative membrane protein YdjX (TVP38/TMEM64 family) [Nocardia bhagyanarayanae]
MTRLLRNPRILALLVGVGALFVAALLVPLPGPTQIQQWADSVGPWFPLLFFGVYSILAVAPLPRTVLTVSCGVLFGSLLGTAIALSATVVAAGMALVLVRALDRNKVASRLTHPAVRAIDERLERRGWLAVGSLRLISFAPFSVVNYCCGLSSIRFWPYLAATFVGSAPGTIATVVLADALTGGSHPAMLVVSGVCLAIGLLGLVVDARWRPETRDAEIERSDELLVARD